MRLSIHLIPFLPSLALAIAYCSVLCSPVQSQEALKSIQPRFSPDPQVYMGATAGRVALQAIAQTDKVNGQCQGFANQQPNYVLKVKESFALLSLKAFATGNEGGLSLLVKGPDGVYCRDASNPELLGAWVSGSYLIWVGSKKGDRLPFRLSISETKQ